MDGHITEIPPYYDHQLETLRLLGEQDRVLDLSDPGTGKSQAPLFRRVDHGFGICEKRYYRVAGELEEAWLEDGGP